MKIELFNSSYYHGKVFLVIILFKICLIVYVIGWKSKGLFESKLLPLHSAFLPKIKYFGYTA